MTATKFLFTYEASFETGDFDPEVLAGVMFDAERDGETGASPWEMGGMKIHSVEVAGSQEAKK